MLTIFQHLSQQIGQKGEEKVLQGGRRKYHHLTLEHKPFFGFTVIDILGEEKRGELEDFVKKNLRNLNEKGRYYAFVNSDFYHITLFDLISEANQDFSLEERQEIADLALDFLKKWEQVEVEEVEGRPLEQGKKKYPLKCQGLSIFNGKHVVLDFQFRDERDKEEILKFREELRAVLITRFGQKYRQINHHQYNPHLTIAYLVNEIKTDQEKERIVQVLMEAHDKYQKIDLGLTLTVGKVCHFENIDVFKEYSGKTRSKTGKI